MKKSRKFITSENYPQLVNNRHIHFLLQRVMPKYPIQIKNLIFLGTAVKNQVNINRIRRMKMYIKISRLSKRHQWPHLTTPKEN